MTSIEINVPCTYSQFQAFLPPFKTMIATVVARLEPFYISYAQKNGLIDPDEVVSVFLQEISVGKHSNGNPLCYADELNSIISYEIVFCTEVNSLSDGFMSEIRKICDDEGYDEWEDRNEVFEDMRESIVEELEHEIEDHVRYLQFSEFNALAGYRRAAS